MERIKVALDKARKARELLGVAKARLAQTMMNIARFYERQRKPGAAVVYYREVVKEYPGTAQARKAEASLRTLTGGRLKK